MGRVPCLSGFRLAVRRRKSRRKAEIDFSAVSMSKYTCLEVFVRRKTARTFDVAVFFFAWAYKPMKHKEGKRMSKKIYVGNLPYKADEETLRDAFGKNGEVLSVRIITDVITGRSKGFGFVEMASEEEGEKAISSLNGTTLFDRTLTVSEARPQTEKGGRGECRGAHGRGGRKPGNWR